MSIKYKIALLTTLWLAGILLAVNVTIYYAFLQITTDNERDYMSSRAEALQEQLSEAKPENLDLLKSFLPDNGMVRLLDEKGQVLQQIQNDNEVVQIERKRVQSEETELYQISGVQILTVRIPAVLGGQVEGTLEIAEKLDVLSENIGILISILTLTTLGAVGMSILGGIFLSKWILRPISGMVRTMEDIERSLVFQKIPILSNRRDELYVMASTFNRMMERIQESFIRQQQFVLDASHELKTPLTVIEGYARMLQRWGMKDESKGREAVENIYLEAVRMKRLTQQLLDLASIEQEPELKLESLELVSLCNISAEMLRSAYQRPISVKSTPAEIPFRADEAKLKQLLIILLDNAIKYSKQEIQLHLFATGAADGNDKGIEIRVKDKGKGIPKEQLSRVFERFYRVDPSRHRNTGGTGLGLSIAREIVNLHGGSIHIQSEEQSGTEVIVFLPAR